MNKTFFLLLIFSILIIGIISCAKKESPQTPFTWIQGKWKLISTGTDDNGDNIIENTEISNEPSGNSDIIYFKGDSTGTESGAVDNVSSPILNFRWSILRSDSLWIAYSAHDTIIYYIDQLNSSNLVLTTYTKLDSGSLLTQKYYDKY